MKALLLLSLLIGCFAFSSCNSKKRLAYKAQTVELSQKLGFKVDRKDDLRLFTEAAGWLGTPYRYGGQTRQGVDCSGLVGQIYRQVYHRSLARSSSDIASQNCRRIGKHKLSAGDLVFFNTSSRKRKGINHVGLFLKNGYFIHASTKRGVIVSHLGEAYYRKAWKRGGRVK